MPARFYTARITALILDVQPKWLDNLLSRHDLPGIARSRQGVERRISDQGLLAIELCRVLNLELGVSLQRAAEIAGASLQTPGDVELRYSTPSGLTISLPIAATRARLRDRTMHAIEMVGLARRGRPPIRR